jgi:hypothetical protein
MIKGKYPKVRSVRLLPEVDEAWDEYERQTGMKFSHAVQIMIAPMIGIVQDIRGRLKGFPADGECNTNDD